MIVCPYPACAGRLIRASAVKICRTRQCYLSVCSLTRRAIKKRAISRH